MQVDVTIHFKVYTTYKTILVDINRTLNVISKQVYKFYKSQYLKYIFTLIANKIKLECDMRHDYMTVVKLLNLFKRIFRVNMF